MKRLIAAGVLAVIVAVVTVSGGILVSKTEKSVVSAAEDIINAPTAEKIEKFTLYWQKTAVPLSFFVNRESIEDIGKAAAKMTSAGKNNDREEILESAEEIKYIIGHIAEQGKFNLLSFF